MVLGPHLLVGMNDGSCEGNYGIKTQAGGDLKLPVTPADGQELAEGGQAEEDDDPEDGECLLQAEEVDTLLGEVSRHGEACHGPEQEPGEGDEDGNRNPGAAREGGAD